MLTIKECRAILKQDAEGLTDEEVIEIRDWLSMLSNMVIEVIEQSQSKNENNTC
jgi:hypothetical protein